ncbi:uncharacterized protein LOC141530861 [Cotesia typhae]|uniref:uncharacterized protein LOC141530861 n=1 Tax=Cotesia typhae TaxID=2053667 RepID=UPI003D698A8F
MISHFQIVMFPDGECYDGFTTFFQWVVIEHSREDILRLSAVVEFVATTNRPAVGLRAISLMEDDFGFLPPELKMARAFFQMPLWQHVPFTLPNVADLELLLSNLLSMAESPAAPPQAEVLRYDDSE